MIILLNMLIAMMSTGYQLIADNIHTEHLYSQTRLWMEYVGPDKTRPVPFNLIPRLQTALDLCTKRDPDAERYGKGGNHLLDISGHAFREKSKLSYNFFKQESLWEMRNISVKIDSAVQ